MQHRDFSWRWRDPEYVDQYVRFTRGLEFDGALWAGRLRLGRTDTMVDLGCGEGKLLLALAPHVARCIGIDLSSGALEYARRNIAAAKASNIELVEQDFRQLDLPVSSVKAFVSFAALHHIPDEEKRQVLGRVKEALVPEGLLHVEDDTFNFSPDQFDAMVPRMYREFEKRFGPKGWSFLKENLAGDDFECTPYLGCLLSLIRSVGLEVIQVSELGLNGAVIRARKPGADSSD
jgi:SAM-dependent methyltransferase